MGRPRRFRAFTLVEVVVVMAVVMLLIAITLPVYRGMGKNQNQQTCLNHLWAIGVNLAQYRQDHGAYPAAPSPQYLRDGDAEYLPFGRTPVLYDVSYSGNGPNDLAVAGNYTGDATSLPVTVTITSVGAPTELDQFSWCENGKNTVGPIDILGDDVKQALVNGIAVQFRERKAPSRTVGDRWFLNAETAVPDTWTEWREDGAPLTQDADPDDVLLRFTNTDLFTAGEPVLLRNAAAGVSDIGMVENVYNSSITLVPYTALRHAYAAGTRVTTFRNVPVTDPLAVKVGNYGLATLFVNGNPQTSGLKNVAYFHCPQLTATEHVERTINIPPGKEGRALHPLDPLYAGYNTYDVTYNYDQYHNEILAFDAALGFGDMNSARQLQYPNAPADTVVCWCYGHAPGQTPTYRQPKADGTPDLVGSTDPAQSLTVLTARERAAATDVALVLWVDGTVAAMRPTLQRTNDSGAPNYFWVPPFLYSKGDWRR